MTVIDQILIGLTLAPLSFWSAYFFTRLALSHMRERR